MPRYPGMVEKNDGSKIRSTGSLGSTRKSVNQLDFLSGLDLKTSECLNWWKTGKINRFDNLTGFFFFLNFF